MRSSYLVFGSPVIEEEEIDEVVKTLKSGWIGTGPKVARFEEEFREYTGAKHAIAVASCTAGLHLSVIALGIGPGDEVIVPVLTFAATANAVIHSGAKPVFADVDISSMTIDPEDVRRKITPRTKAIIPVHFAGRACRLDELEAIAREHNLYLIQDTAHALETEYHGRKIGTFDHLASYSFYVTKNITTAEGGMVTTNDEEIANRLKIYALHGMSKDAWKRFSDDGYKHYEVVFPGFKYNMTDIQASLGIHQLRKIERLYKRRQEIWQAYHEKLKHLPIILPTEAEEGTRHGLHLFIILVDTSKTGITRDELLTALHKQNIGTGVHYIALHHHPYYKQTYGYKQGDFPNAEFISDRTLSIPFSAKLTDADVDDVADALNRILN
ncbi:MAG: DegT/DnrJ/EryC1/StrS family aminotransferase [Ignavibacteriaceae bacterium]|nr:DegT/DnrJ/EryC1/StrS family aminotransferase [Ignavibacteriaceae bacterium]